MKDIIIPCWPLCAKSSKCKNAETDHVSSFWWANRLYSYYRDRKRIFQYKICSLYDAFGQDCCKDAYFSHLLYTALFSHHHITYYRHINQAHNQLLFAIKMKYIPFIWYLFSFDIIPQPGQQHDTINRPIKESVTSLLDVLAGGLQWEWVNILSGVGYTDK